jgi:hypothetical protein
MITSSESVDIARPMADVYAYVADLRNEPLWHVVSRTRRYTEVDG